MAKINPRNLFFDYTTKLSIKEKISNIDNLYQYEINELEKKLSEIRNRKERLKEPHSKKLAEVESKYPDNALDNFMKNLFEELGVTSNTTKNIIISGIESAYKNKEKYYYFNPKNPLHNSIPHRHNCFTIDLKTFQVDVTRSEMLKRLLDDI